MEVLNTINTIKAKMEALEERVNNGMTEATRNVVVMREAKIEAPRTPVIKGVCDTKEVENFLWHLEKYFWHVRMRDDKAKIITV